MSEVLTTSLNGKVAVVTGGGGGIGKAISLSLAAHGASVVVAEIDPGRAAETVEEIRKSGARALSSVVDVQEKDQVQSMADAAIAEFGQVDILVNNVGHFLNIRGEFINSTEEEWEALYHINLKHVFYCCRTIAPGMIERGAGGSIINVSTVEAFRSIPELAVYSAFNSGITHFTKSFAMEVARYGIRVNDIAPDVTRSLQCQYEKWIPEEHHHLWSQWVPLGRYGLPEEIAGVALFLASDLSRFVTGTTIHADGGTYAAGGWYRTDRGGWTNRPLKP